jgi:ketosteroid isomerase-like protein
MLDAFNRRDIQGVLESYHPDGEMFTLTSLLRGEPYHGHEGIREFFSSSADVWASIHLEADEVRDLGDAVLVTGRWSSTGRDSGAAVESKAAWLFEFRDGRIFSSRAYQDAEEALSARRPPPRTS